MVNIMTIVNLLYQQAPPFNNITNFDLQVLNYTNQARTNPKSFIPYLESILASQGTPPANLRGRFPYNLVEGSEIINETIDFLNSTEPVGSLAWLDALNQSCQLIVNDTGRLGLVQHELSNGTS